MRGLEEDLKDKQHESTQLLGSSSPLAESWGRADALFYYIWFCKGRHAGAIGALKAPKTSISGGLKAELEDLKIQLEQDAMLHV